MSCSSCYYPSIHSNSIRTSARDGSPLPRVNPSEPSPPEARHRGLSTSRGRAPPRWATITVRRKLAIRINTKPPLRGRTAAIPPLCNDSWVPPQNPGDPADSVKGGGVQRLSFADPHLNRRPVGIYQQLQIGVQTAPGTEPVEPESDALPRSGNQEQALRASRIRWGECLDCA